MGLLIGDHLGLACWKHVLLDEIAGPFANHDGWRVGVATGYLWADAQVCHAQILQSMDLHGLCFAEPQVLILSSSESP
jgi:hypothetical protein